MYKEIIINNKDICNYIESLQYEIICRKNLIEFINLSEVNDLLNNSLDRINNELDEFEFMYNEALELLIELYTSYDLKNELGEITHRCFNSQQGLLKLKGSNINSEK